MPLPLQVLATIDPPWTSAESVRVGPADSALRTPDRYVVAQCSQREHPLRIDVYFDPDEYNFKVAAERWNHFIAVAAGESLYLVNLDSERTLRVPLCGYFCEFGATDDQLIVASAEQVIALDPMGQVLWRSEPLGVDGVVIHEVTDSVIRGAGEWDPPGGWKEFTISRQSGEHAR